MACNAVLDYLEQESGRYIQDLIARRVFARSFWLGLIRRATFPQGMGYSISKLVYERSAPTEAAPTWQDMAIDDGQEGGLCLPAPNKIAIGSTSYSMNLSRRVIEGPDFCADDLRYKFSLTQQLNSIVGVLTDYAALEWEIRDRNEYFRLCKTKIVVDASLTTTTTMATTYPASEATGILQLGILDKLRPELIRDGAAESAMLRDDNGPVLTVITSPEASGNIIRQNSTLRSNIQYAWMGSKAGSLLVQAYGVNYTLQGFAFLSDFYNRRFTYSGGVYTQVPAFTMATGGSGTRGQKAEVNSSWKTATKEETFIFDQKVFTQYVPEPITNPANKFNFDPVNYVGDIQALNIPDRVCNPRGTILFHQGVLAAASLPEYPERGVAIVHLRCDPAYALVTTCPT